MCLKWCCSRRATKILW